MQFGSCEPGKQVVRCRSHGRSVESTLYVVLCFSIHSLVVCESSCNLILECQDYTLYWAVLLSINEMRQVGIPRIVRKKKRQTAERQPDTYVPKDMAGLVRHWNLQVIRAPLQSS